MYRDKILINIKSKSEMLQTVSPNFALKQYFTEATDVNSAMCSLLGDVSGLDVLEPSVGSGALLSGLQGKPARVDLVDIDPDVLSLAQSQSPAAHTEVHCADFIDIFAQGLLAPAHPIAGRQFDAVIANPPFGLYLDLAYRRRLKKLYPNLYVRESFGLFFVFSVTLLRPGGRYVFLMPDTFLTSKNHAPLRRFICDEASPDTIIRFPSRRFEKVAFGYGHLCLIAGSRGKASRATRTTLISAFDDDAGLLEQPQSAVRTVSGDALEATAGTGWQSGTDGDLSLDQGWLKLGDLAECKTGIYTGDNKRFIGYDPARVSRRLNGHPVEWERDVLTRIPTPIERAGGLTEKDRYVPLVRGGHRAFDERTAWCIKWDKASIEFYRCDKKARFQNASFYFRSGLAVPMVTSRRLSASILEAAVFDQGVVGVFPKNPDDRDPLLLYLNSSLASKLRNQIVNGSANNSANYLKRLPVPAMTEADRDRAKRLVSEAIERGELSREVCDAFVDNLLPAEIRG